MSIQTKVIHYDVTDDHWLMTSNEPIRNLGLKNALISVFI